ncbi:XRE family transcriptional regulator [Mitsuokella sp. AF21-1AC]|nr:XRE family transcriptional regulator [Mitsuokella sp. AF21-1AC]
MVIPSLSTLYNILTEKLYRNDGNTIDTMTEILYIIGVDGNTSESLLKLKKEGDVMDQIAETLRDARKSKRLTQTEVAKSVGVSRAYYADVERGRYNPSLKLMSRLAKLLGINLNFLKKNDGNTSET